MIVVMFGSATGTPVQAAAVRRTVNLLTALLVAFAVGGHGGVHHPVSSLCQERDLLSASFLGSEFLRFARIYLDFVAGVPPCFLDATFCFPAQSLVLDYDVFHLCGLVQDGGF